MGVAAEKSSSSRRMMMVVVMLVVMTMCVEKAEGICFWECRDNCKVSGPPCWMPCMDECRKHLLYAAPPTREAQRKFDAYAKEGPSNQSGNQNGGAGSNVARKIKPKQ